MLNSGVNRPADEGARSYPVAAMEITLLDLAQQRATRQEANIFRQLCFIFDWQLTARQRNRYLRRLKDGSTLVLTDSTRVILWVSHSFTRMTGYAVAEVIGQKPSMLQGPATDLGVIHCILEQLIQAKAVRADLINYRKNGVPYMCRVVIDPLRNTQGELTHFIAVEREIPYQANTGL